MTCMAYTHILWHFVWHICWQFICHTFWHLLWRSIWHSIWRFVWRVFCHLAQISQWIWHNYFEHYWPSIWHYYYTEDYLARILTYTLTFYVTCQKAFSLISPICSDIPFGIYSGGLSGIWHMRWRSIWHFWHSTCSQCIHSTCIWNINEYNSMIFYVFWVWVYLFGDIPHMSGVPWRFGTKRPVGTDASRSPGGKAPARSAGARHRPAWSFRIQRSSSPVTNSESMQII